MHRKREEARRTRASYKNQLSLNMESNEQRRKQRCRLKSRCVFIKKVKNINFPGIFLGRPGTQAIR